MPFQLGVMSHGDITQHLSLYQMENHECTLNRNYLGPLAKARATCVA